MTDQEDQANREDRDQADLEDAADVQDHADEAEHTDRGDRGRRGIQGLRGRPGTDSDSIEKLTEVLDELKTQLVGLREDVQTERKGRRLSLVVIGAAFTLATTVGAVGYTNYQTLSDAQAVEIAANTYDQELGLSDACLRDNVSRESRRRLFLGFYDIIADTTPATPRTPAEQEVVDDFLERARVEVLTETELIDCATIAPAPEGERPT